MIEDEKVEEQKEMLKWDAEEESAYIAKTWASVQEGTITLKELKYDENFCLRITQLMG